MTKRWWRWNIPDDSWFCDKKINHLSYNKLADLNWSDGVDEVSNDSPCLGSTTSPPTGQTSLIANMLHSEIGTQMALWSTLSIYHCHQYHELSHLTLGLCPLLLFLLLLLRGRFSPLATLGHRHRSLSSVLTSIHHQMMPIFDKISKYTTYQCIETFNHMAHFLILATLVKQWQCPTVLITADSLSERRGNQTFHS